MIRRNIRILMTLIVPLVLVAVSVGILLMYSAQSEKRARELNYDILKAAGSEQRDLFRVKLDGEQAVLKTLSSVVASSAEAEDEMLMEHLRAAAASSDFEYFCVADMEGNGYTNEGETIYLGDRSYMQETLAGSTTVAHVTDARVGDESSAFILAVPILHGDEVTGAVAGLLGENGFRDLLLMKAYSGSVSFICDSAGRVIVGNSDASGIDRYETLMNVFENAVFDKPYTAAQAQTSISGQAEGFVSYTIDGAHWYLAYLPLGANDWMICTAIPGSVVDGTLRSERSGGFLLIGAAMICALLLILFVVALYAGANRRARREREQLMAAEEEYRISAQQSGAMILRYDLEADMLMPNESANAEFRLPLEATNFDYAWALDSLVAEGSRADYEVFWDAIQAGEANGCAELQMQNAKGELRWYAFAFTAIKNNAGKSAQAVITVRDITAQREKMMEYERWRGMVTALIGKSAAYVEINLTTGGIERVEGDFDGKPEDGGTSAEELLRCFEYNHVDAGDRERFHSFLSLERLKSLLFRGVLKDESEIRLLREDGSARLCSVSVQMSQTPDTNEAKAIIAVTDLGESQRDFERLSDLAFKDELSGLLNRTAARAAIEERLRFGTCDEVALFMLDVDNFKRVNDTMGHQQGDKALERCGEILKSVFRSTDVIARIGGDEFFVFLEDASVPGLVEAKAAALCEAMFFSYTDGRQSVPVSTSVGVILARREDADYESLYAEADAALYEAKNAGKNQFRIRRLKVREAAEGKPGADAARFTQLYSLLKYVDGGVALLEMGEKTELLFQSGGGMENGWEGFNLERDVHPDDRETLFMQMRACAQSGTAFEAIFRSRQSGGGYGWRHLHAARIPYAGSKNPVLIAAATDITELRRSVDRLESFTSSASIGIVIFRFGERVEATFFNDAVLRMLNLTYGQFSLLARDCSALFRPEELRQARAAVRRAEREKIPLEFSFQTADREGLYTRIIHAHGAKIDEQNGVPAYLLLLAEELAEGLPPRED